MSAQDPSAKLSKWLFERLSNSPVNDYIPRENLQLICERAVFFFYKEGALEAEGLVEWLENEYSVPGPMLVQVISALKQEARQSPGLEIVMPGESPPGPRAEAQAAPGPEQSTRQDQAKKPENIPGPLAPEAEQDPGASFKMIEHDDAARAAPIEPARQQERPAQSPARGAVSPQSQGPAAKPARPGSPEGALAEAPTESARKKAWQYFKPPRRDPSRNLSAFLHDAKYLEWAVLDYALDGEGLGDPVIKHVLAERFRFEGDEKGLLCDSALEPGSSDDSVAGWCLKICGMALAYGFAYELARGGDHDRAEWVRGVRQLNATFGELMTRILAKRAEARKAGGAELAALEASYKRLKQLHGLVEPVFWDKPGTRPPPAKPAARPAARAASRPAAPVVEAEGLRGVIDRNSTLLIVLAALVFVACLAYGLFRLGIFGAPGVKPLSIDLSALGLPAQSVTAQGGSMVVVIDADSWSKNSAGEKKRILKGLYKKAIAQGLTQVQLRTRGDKVLAQVLANENFLIFP